MSHTVTPGRGGDVLSLLCVHELCGVRKCVVTRHDEAPRHHEGMKAEPVLRDLWITQCVCVCEGCASLEREYKHWAALEQWLDMHRRGTSGTAETATSMTREGVPPAAWLYGGW